MFGSSSDLVSWRLLFDLRPTVSNSAASVGLAPAEVNVCARARTERDRVRGQS